MHRLPLKSGDPAELARCVMTDSFGTEISGGSGGCLTLRQHPCPMVDDGTGQGVIDAGAIIALFDHALGGSVSLAGYPPQQAVTLDLRIDWTGTPDGIVEIETKAVICCSQIAIASAAHHE